MAQSGFTPIQLYSTSTASAVPSATNLTNSTLGSELAINITDGKLFYKDNANNVQVIGWKVVPATAGGTGQTSYAVGDILYADTTTSLAKLADVATGNALISGGVGVAPAWGKIGLTTHVSGTLPVANGGTGTTTAFTTGSVVFAGASGVYSQNNANLFWDNTNAALGIGTTSPNTYGKLGVVSGACYFGIAQNAFNSAIFGVRPNNDGFCTMAYSYGTVGSGNNWILDHSSGNIDWSRLAGGASGGTLMQLGSTGNLTVNQGNVIIGTSGKGIDFSATAGTGTSELLADYEEGTWTPTISGGATSVSYTTQSGTYTKVGRLVTFRLNLVMSAATANGNAFKVGGLPFTAGIQGGASFAYDNGAWTGSATTNMPMAFVGAGGTEITFFQGTGGQVVGTDLVNIATDNFYLFGEYMV